MHMFTYTTLNKQDKMTPLHIAVCFNSIDTVFLLIGNNINNSLKQKVFI